MMKPDTYVLTVQFTRSISADAEVCDTTPDDPSIYTRLVAQFVKELQMAYEPESDIGMDGQFTVLSLVHGDTLVPVAKATADPINTSRSGPILPEGFTLDRDGPQDWVLYHNGRFVATTRASDFNGAVANLKRHLI